MLNSVFNSPLAKVGIRYGAIAAVLTMGFVVSMYYMDRHPFLMNPFLDFRIAVFGVLLYFALKEARVYYLDGALFFWQGMIGGFVFTVVCASLCWFMILLFATWQPRFVSSFIELAMTQAKSFPTEDIDRIGRNVYEQGLQELKNTDARFMASRYLVQSFIIGFFISIIISVVLRREPQN